MARVLQTQSMEIQFGPNIKDWPEMVALTRKLSY